MHFLKSLTTFLFLIIFNLRNEAYSAPKEQCSPKQLSEFRDNYFKLQRALQYDGKDVKFKKNADGSETLDLNAKKLKYEEHGSLPYNGKIIEKKLYEQYQNALKKVAKVINNNKPNSSLKLANPAPELISFFSSINPLGVTSDDFHQKLKFSKLLLELQKASENNGQHKINVDDIYLLENLFVHSHDFRCRVEWLKTNPGKIRKEELEETKKIARSPLNAMIRSLSTLNENSDLNLVKEDRVIDIAVEENIKALNNWAKTPLNSACYNFLKNNPNSTNIFQNKVQQCNNLKFLETLGNSNVTLFEQILHFINANQKHRTGKPLSQTALSIESLEGVLTSTFGDKKTLCINGVKGKFKLINPPLKNGTYDLSRFTCKDKNNKSSLCTDKNIKISSDKYGEQGVEIEAIGNSKNRPVSFSITDVPDCQDRIFNSVTQLSKPTDSSEENKCKEKNKDTLASGDYAIHEWRTDPPKCHDLKAECIENVKKEWDAKKGCVDKKLTEPSEENKCKEKNKDLLASGDIAIHEWRTDPPKCLDLKAQCIENVKKEWDAKNGCVDKKPTESSAENMCKEKNKDTLASGDYAIYEWRTDPPKCHDLKAECIENVKKEWDAKNGCVNKPVDNQAQKNCENKNKKWLKDSDKEHGIRHSWNEGKKICDDLKPEQTETAEKVDEKDDSIPIDSTPKPVPPSFVPVNIPTRQMYVLPGMP